MEHIDFYINCTLYHYIIWLLAPGSEAFLLSHSPTLHLPR